MRAPKIQTLHDGDLQIPEGTIDGAKLRVVFSRVFSQLNPFFDAIGKVNAQGIDLGINLNADVLTFPITTPATPWLVPALLNSYTVQRTVGYYRDALGIVRLRGAVTGGAADAVLVLPAGYLPDQSWYFATDHAGAYGRVIVDTGGNVTSDVGGHTSVSLDGIAFPAPNGSAGSLSCFPQNVRVRSSKTVLGVLLLAAADTNQSAVPAIAPGGVSWIPLGQTSTVPNQIKIVNIPGLALGRTYNITILAVYKA